MGDIRNDGNVQTIIIQTSTSENFIGKWGDIRKPEFVQSTFSQERWKMGSISSFKCELSLEKMYLKSSKYRTHWWMGYIQQFRPKWTRLCKDVFYMLGTSKILPGCML